MGDVPPYGSDPRSKKFRASTQSLRVLAYALQGAQEASNVLAEAQAKAQTLEQEGRPQDAEQQEKIRTAQTNLADWTATAHTNLLDLMTFDSLRLENMGDVVTASAAVSGGWRGCLGYASNMDGDEVMEQLGEAGLEALGQCHVMKYFPNSNKGRGRG